MFNKVSLIITIVCFSYSILGFLFLLGLKIHNRIKARRIIKETSESISHIEVNHYEKK